MHGFKAIYPLAVTLIVIAATSAAFGQTDDGTGGGGDQFELMQNLVIPLVLAAVFTVVGLILFGLCLWIVVRVAPFSVRKEIEEDQNTSLGIIVGAMILGIAIILAAAIHG